MRNEILPMRNIFYRFSNAMARFMYGRNGSDQLNAALLAAYLVVCVVRILLARVSAAATVCDLLSMLLALAVIFRMFSRNLTRRRAENAWFLSRWYPVKNRISGARQRSLDKEHKYFTCKNCRSICRVPVGKGKIEITCPKCGGKIIGKS